MMLKQYLMNFLTKWINKTMDTCKYRFTMNEIKRLPTHPKDVLKEELESKGINQKYYSELAGVSYTMLNEILNGKRPVTTDFALLVEASLGVNPEILINMQTRYNMALSYINNKLSERLDCIRKICAAL